MSVTKVSLASFVDTLSDIVEKYGQAVEDEVSNEIAKEGRKTAKELRQASPRSAKMPMSGEYASGWMCSVKKQAFYSEIVVHNRHAGMPHLLENGHAIANQAGYLGGSVEGKPHVSVAQNNLNARVPEAIKRALEKAQREV